MGTPRVSKTPIITTDKVDKVPVSIPEPSPNTKKKKLAELFRESMGNSKEAPAAADGDESKSSPEKETSEPQQSTKTILDVLPSSEHGTPLVSQGNSLCNSERVPNESDQDEKLEKPMHQRCLPSLMSCRISAGRKKKMAPAIAVHD